MICWLKSWNIASSYRVLQWKSIFIFFLTNYVSRVKNNLPSLMRNEEIVIPLMILTHDKIPTRGDMNQTTILFFNPMRKWYFVKIENIIAPIINTNKARCIRNMEWEGLLISYLGRGNDIIIIWLGIIDNWSFPLTIISVTSFVLPSIFLSDQFFVTIYHPLFPPQFPSNDNVLTHRTPLYIVNIFPSPTVKQNEGY